MPRQLTDADVARIADGIATLFPGRTLDAGSASVLLVEALRARDIEAYGQASATDEIEGTYDLIVCIEIFPHLTEEAGRQAVANFCRHAGRVLFSSGDHPPHEQHLNALGPGHWDAVFAEAGFFPDPRADVTFLTPWAALYCDSR